MGVPIDRGLTHYFDRLIVMLASVEMGVPIDRGLTRIPKMPHTVSAPRRNGCPDR